MKHLILLFVVFQLSAIGQNTMEPLPDLESKSGFETTVDTSIYSVVEIPASYPTGPNGMKEFVASRTKALEPKLAGTVVFKTIVEINGTLTMLKTTKSPANCSTCEAEALKIIKAMPPWTPAEYNGKKVRSYFNVSIKLDLQ